MLEQEDELPKSDVVELKNAGGDHLLRLLRLGDEDFSLDRLYSGLPGRLFCPLVPPFFGPYNGPMVVGKSQDVMMRRKMENYKKNLYKTTYK